MAAERQVFAALTSADGYKTLLSNLGKDPMEPSMELVGQRVTLSEDRLL